MSIFLSWSGRRSKVVAECFNQQLKVLEIDSWLSEDNLKKGQSWFTEIATKLEEHSGCILFLTKSNLQSSWLNFEAGAISKKRDQARVCTYLIDIDNPSDVSPPLSLFQATRSTKEDTLRLLCDLKEWIAADKYSKENTEKIFERIIWEDISQCLSDAHNASDDTPTPPERSATEKVDEVLNTLRLLEVRHTQLGDRVSTYLNTLSRSLDRLRFDSKVAGERLGGTPLDMMPIQSHYALLTQLPTASAGLGSFLNACLPRDSDLRRAIPLAVSVAHGHPLLSATDVLVSDELYDALALELTEQNLLEIYGLISKSVFESTSKVSSQYKKSLNHQHSKAIKAFNGFLFGDDYSD